jgi:hypothetical protein
MKTLSFIIILIAGITGFFLPVEPIQGVNPILGDKSYHQLYHSEVPKNFTEQKRIQIHLAYVENLLMQADVSRLSPELRKNRSEAIALLHAYWKKGEFPSNYDYLGERKPCFRDKNDRICAVGYLVQQTGNELLVEAIEATQNYATIYEMTNADLSKWVATSGLTLKECAMIQPTYSTPPENDPNYIPTAYALSSSAISGIGLSTTLISMGNLKTPTKFGWITPAVGITAGISQLTIGAINYNRQFPNDAWGWGSSSIYKRHQNLSMFNVGFGTLTTALNSYALFQQLRGKKKRTDLSWNVYGFQSPKKDYSFGFNLIKQF